MTLKFLVISLLIIAVALPASAQGWPEIEKPAPSTYFGLFTGTGVNLNLTNGEVTNELYLPSVIFTPIEYGTLVLEDYGIGVSARLQFGSLDLNEDKMGERLNENPPYHIYDLSYWVSSTSGGYYAMHMGVFYSAAMAKSHVVDFNAMAGAAQVSPPSYLIIGRESQKVRYVKESKWREELQPTFAAGITIRQKKIASTGLAARAEYTYVADTHFMYITLGVLRHHY